MDTAEIVKNSFTAISTLSKQFGLRKVDGDDPNITEHIGLFLKGDFELWDYGHGIICGHIKVCPNIHHPDMKERFAVYFYFTNADDGSWNAWSFQTTQEEAVALGEELVKFFDQHPRTLPSHEEINLFLRPLGMYGVFN